MRGRVFRIRGRGEGVLEVCSSYRVDVCPAISPENKTTITLLEKFHLPQELPSYNNKNYKLVEAKRIALSVPYSTNEHISLQHTPALVIPI